MNYNLIIKFVMFSYETMPYYRAEGRSYPFLLIPLFKNLHWKWVAGYAGVVSLWKPTKLYTYTQQKACF